MLELKLLFNDELTIFPVAVNVTVLPAQIVFEEAVKLILQPGAPKGSYNTTLADHPGDCVASAL